MKRWIIDTGPLVAYLDAGDPFHAVVSSTLDEFTGRLHTTSAVVTEAMHFLTEAASGQELLVEFLMTSGTEIFEMMRPAQLQSAVALMRKYADTPMDFADATLVLLAEDLSLTEILTLDRRGFRVYRTRSGKALQLVLK